MRKTIIIYGLSLAALAVVLKVLEYRYFFNDITIEVYMASVAVMFTLIGAWIGNRFLNRSVSASADSFRADEKIMEEAGISRRESEVLALMAEGCSNQEIADRLFVSVSTIKTHSANIYSKLDVKRRTQAIQKAKSMKIIP